HFHTTIPSALNQTNTNMTSTDADFVSAVEQEHKEVRGFYEQFKSSQDFENKKRALIELIRSLSQHSHKEALYLYPLVESELKDGKHLVKVAIGINL
ncbi:unnamed protein product, partial [Didymodactylos carnosus]